MRKHTWFVVTLIALVFSVCGWYLYKDIKNARNQPQDPDSQNDLAIVLTEAHQLRYSIPPSAFVLLPIIVWAFAITRAVVLSWLRTLLAFAVSVTLLFTLFTNLTESRIQAHSATYYLPFNVVLSLLSWAVVSTSVSLTLWFVVERLYIRRIAPNA